MFRVPAPVAPLAVAATLVAFPACAEAPWSALKETPAAVGLTVKSAPAFLRDRGFTWPQAEGASTTDISSALAARLADWSSPRRKAIAAYYAARDFAPLWRDGERFSIAAHRAAETIRNAAQDGLSVASPLPAENESWSVAGELALSEAVADYAAQATGARVDPAKISKLIGARPQIATPAQALESIANAGENAGAALAAFNPPQPGYLALRDKLAELRLMRANDGRVAIAARGDVTPSHSFAMMSDAEAKRAEAEIVANMERWRWEPRSLGATHVAVNIPQFELALYRDGAPVHRARVVVGKTSTPTPVFSDRMRYVVINPSWSVPPSIIAKEMAPKGGGDLSYLAARGFQVSYNGGRVSVRQPPGEKNALGRVKFVFPNDYSVYMHDTPSRGLFAAARRAYSHGCVRVDNPFSFAEAVLTPEGYSAKRLRAMIGPSERRIDLSAPMPVHIEYFTATVENGQLRFFDDIYGYSAKVRAALADR